MVFELYDLLVLVAGVLLFGIAILPRFVAERPVSLPIFFVGFGALVFSVPVGIPPLDPLEQPATTERLAEFGVIIALMGLGLKIDRPPGLRAWASTWRLLAVAMPLSIAGAALLGWWVLGFGVPTAVLLGAVIAPTDPVLAAEVQVDEPRTGESDDPDRDAEDDEVPFALSSEAGLNDGLAFPFTNLAIVVALVGLAPQGWLVEWLVVDVGYRIVVGTVLGVALGWLVSRLIFLTAPETRIARSVQGLEAVAGTLTIYGLTEAVGGYGFIAVFVAAVTIRSSERTHEYNESLHLVAELAEQLAMGAVMIFFGGAIASGLLAPLTLQGAIVAALVVFVVRPFAGVVSLLGFSLPWAARGTIAFFGIRGIGSFYYLSHGLNEAIFSGADRLWALVGAVVLVSIVVHGVTATPIVSRLSES